MQMEVAEHRKVPAGRRWRGPLQLPRDQTARPLTTVWGSLVLRPCQNQTKRECGFGFFLRYLIAWWEQRLLGKQVYACTEKQFPAAIK